MRAILSSVAFVSGGAGWATAVAASATPKRRITRGVFMGEATSAQLVSAEITAVNARCADTVHQQNPWFGKRVMQGSALASGPRCGRQTARTARAGPGCAAGIVVH